MLSQSNLANRFRDGATSGRASNVQIVELCGGWTALVGYGWAAYAVRTNDGTIHYYKGWYGYSPSTSCQLTAMSLEGTADVIHDDAAEVSEFNVSSVSDMPDPEAAGGTAPHKRRGRW